MSMLCNRINNEIQPSYEHISVSSFSAYQFPNHYFWKVIWFDFHTSSLPLVTTSV
ncbi:hypothetical protein [Xenorhabdus innexi]|uniref:Non-ribosomal peptide synthetase n=1 Tax=Xenorhabdus innexi TaxID=290109 RepID=A0A1N6MWC9_9GAMM|nr:hypothetical protein [Xenorhabdus innexi]PHM36583.1 non-ribosomal peptide synthetase [Xenorhabdus innexi]SIP73130.1 hypothetical protein XIS1_1750022 [Xenorhabdus innexi]